MHKGPPIASMTWISEMSSIGWGGKDAPSPPRPRSPAPPPGPRPLGAQESILRGDPQALVRALLEQALVEREVQRRDLVDDQVDVLVGGAAAVSVPGRGRGPLSRAGLA